MTALLQPCPKGLLFVVSAPAGTGKTTLVQRLIQEFSPAVLASVSYTTRQPRAGEKEGRDYYFVTKSEFEEKMTASDFLEYVKLYDDYYGTSQQWVFDQQNQGKHVILVIDTQGALLLKKRMPGVFIFISPPSLEILKERLMKRGTETGHKITQRLQWAEKELSQLHHYDYQVVNDDLETAYQALRSIVIAETHRIR